MEDFIPAVMQYSFISIGYVSFCKFCKCVYTHAGIMVSGFGLAVRVRGWIPACMSRCSRCASGGFLWMLQFPSTDMRDRLSGIYKLLVVCECVL